MFTERETVLPKHETLLTLQDALRKSTLTTLYKGNLGKTTAGSREIRKNVPKDSAERLHILLWEAGRTEELQKNLPASKEIEESKRRVTEIRGG